MIPRGGAASGILILGAGVLIIALGWSGTLGNVWAAITGGIKPDQPTDPGTASGAVPDGSGCLYDADCNSGSTCQWNGSANQYQCTKSGGTQTSPPPPTDPGHGAKRCPKGDECPAGFTCTNDPGMHVNICMPNDDGTKKCPAVPDMHRVKIGATGVIVCVHGGSNGDVSGQNADGTCPPGWLPGFEILSWMATDDTSRPVCVKPVRGAGAAHQWSIGTTATGKRGLLYEPNVLGSAL